MTGVASDVVHARREAESVMLDRCVIERESGRTWNEERGRNEPTYVAIYDHPTAAGTGAKCGIRDGHDIRVAPGGLAIEGLVLTVPVSAGPFKKGDRVRHVHSATDPTFTPATFVIDEIVRGSRLTARRMKIKEVAAP